MMSPLVVWRLSDGKRGHDNQSLGLLESLQRFTTVDGYELSLQTNRLQIIFQAIMGHLPGGLPKPQLLIGAGHKTHLPLIFLTRAAKARSVVLMKPTLPTACFDYCLIPAHDQARQGGNVLTTHGALNRIRPGKAHESELGLILLGGPSRHHRWDPESIVRQVTEILAANPNVHWHLGNSRRTPVDTLQRLGQLKSLTIHDVTATSMDWLPTMLGTCGQVWVSADSVSMAYEAVTAGTATGILEVSAKSPGNRVERAVAQLVQKKRVLPMAQWRTGKSLIAPAVPLQEADRSAQWVLQQLPHLNQARSDA